VRLPMLNMLKGRYHSRYILRVWSKIIEEEREDVVEVGPRQ
jgi:hypothetical protein